MIDGRALFTVAFVSCDTSYAISEITLTALFPGSIGNDVAVVLSPVGCSLTRPNTDRKKPLSLASFKTAVAAIPNKKEESENFITILSVNLMVEQITQATQTRERVGNAIGCYTVIIGIVGPVCKLL